jgi:hypothetical protein
MVCSGLHIFFSLLQLPILLFYCFLCWSTATEQWLYSPFSSPPSIGHQAIYIKVSSGFGAHPASYPSQLVICFHTGILLGLFNPKYRGKMSVDGFVIYVEHYCLLDVTDVEGGGNSFFQNGGIYLLDYIAYILG